MPKCLKTIDSGHINQEGGIIGMEQMDNIIQVPVWHKYSLSVEEAAAYYGIGEKRLRSIAVEHEHDGFILEIGSHIRFKRERFEAFLDSATAV